MNNSAIGMMKRGEFGEAIRELSVALSAFLKQETVSASPTPLQNSQDNISGDDFYCIARIRISCTFVPNVLTTEK